MGGEVEKYFWIVITKAFLVTIFLFCTVKSASASGYAVFTQGASALGQGNAVIAHGDGPSAVFFNPAQINALEGTQIELGATLIFASREFESDATGKTFDADTTSYPSTFYATHRFNDRICAGLGVFNPFGLRNNWGNNWEGRYITTDSDLTTFNVNPVVSFQLTPALSMAAGVDVLIMDATLKKNLRLTPLPDAKQKFDGDGTGVGFNVGLLYHLTKDIAFGAAYRSEVKVDLDGKATFDLPQGTPPQIAGLLQDTKGHSTITLPAQVFAGISYQGFSRLTLEAGLRWEGWSSFDQLKIDLEGPLPSSVTERDWNDVFSFNIGAKYRLNERCSLLAGYLYGNTPVPDKTFDPTIPDSDTHVFTLGTEIKFDKFNFALSYAYQHFEDRDKNNQIPSDAQLAIDRANGTYKTDLNLVAASLAYRF
jgi:long-chain fatty acid transport protein